VLGRCRLPAVASGRGRHGDGGEERFAGRRRERGVATPEVLSRPGADARSTTVRAGRRAYATSKLGGIHLVHAWARRLPEGVDIVAYNPSLVIGTVSPATPAAHRTS
jgi:NAD(P)-dependent dehydrogenase (short-subunit alcohol dehydrogenase family)